MVYDPFHRYSICLGKSVRVEFYLERELIKSYARVVSNENQVLCGSDTIVSCGVAIEDLYAYIVIGEECRSLLQLLE